MLNRTTVSTPLPRVAWGALRKRLLADPNAWLFQSVLIAVIMSLFACAYLWQSSVISDINGDTRVTWLKAEDLERSNTGLMVQLAKWNHPAHIEQMARKQGMVPAQPPLVMQVPIRETNAKSANSLAGLWHGLVARLPAAGATMHIPIWAR
jgi:hypothetical protein